MIHILPLFDDDAYYPRLDLFDIIKIFMIYREYRIIVAYTRRGIPPPLLGTS